MKKKSKLFVFFSILLVILLISIMGVLIVNLAQNDNPVSNTQEESKISLKTNSNIKLYSQPKKLPVAGIEGYFVIIDTDGSTYMEYPDGSKVQLTDTPKDDSKLENITNKVISNISEDKKKELGELIVCDKGIIDIPRGSIITYIGKDRVVTHNNNGSSVTYFTDGKVVKNDRSERKK